MVDWYLDRTLVKEFVGGGLEPPAEEFLANQVARLMPFHWMLPNPLAADMSDIIRKLGGDAGLLEWLDRHPGRPRLAAGLYRAVALLDRVSAEPAVVTALSEFRVQDSYPPDLEDHLIPVTSDETLASLSYRVEALLGEDRRDEAVSVADAALDMLGRIAPRAAELDPRLRELPAEVEQVRGALRAAVDAR